MGCLLISFVREVLFVVGEVGGRVGTGLNKVYKSDAEVGPFGWPGNDI